MIHCCFNTDHIWLEKYVLCPSQGKERRRKRQHHNWHELLLLLKCWQPLFWHGASNQHMNLSAPLWSLFSLHFLHSFHLAALFSHLKPAPCSLLEVACSTTFLWKSHQSTFVRTFLQLYFMHIMTSLIVMWCLVGNYPDIPQFSQRKWELVVKRGWTCRTSLIFVVVFCVFAECSGPFRRLHCLVHGQASSPQ